LKKFLVLAALISANSFATIEHSISIIQRPDGMFDVTCIDGNVEVKTKEDLLKNRVCTLFNTVIGAWTLIDGGIENGKRMCDLNLSIVRSDDAIFKLTAQFTSPCTGQSSLTQDCRAMSCSLQLDNKFYAMDFATEGRMNMTRIEDGFQAGYKGDAGRGGPGGRVLGNVRTVTMDTVDNVLQATNDGGKTWKAVCDDSFGVNEALVACHEMGYSSVDHLEIAISVSGDSDYGFDDVVCQGTEKSLNDCKHTPWGMHNCGENEHIQLTCGM
jgi:hypothetical protein